MLIMLLFPEKITARCSVFGFYIPTNDPARWQQFLAEPEKQWREGYSAKTLAHCWEAARGFPPEIARLFAELGLDAFTGIEPLLALVEHKVPMPGQGYPSQNDLFVLAKASGQLISLTIEGKVDELFGPLLKDWNDDLPNKQVRLNGILNMLGLTQDVSGQVRYQLLHRMASAVSEARRFGASSAVMLIHSFSPVDRWLEDYQVFLALYGVQGAVGRLMFLRQVSGINLYAGWAHGDTKFLNT